MEDATEVAVTVAGRCPGPSVQDIYAADAVPPPAVLRHEAPPRPMSDADIGAERYWSRDWHEREVRGVWERCWQMACRIEQLPEVGDHVVYDIAHHSLIVVRTGPDPTDVAAYVKSCLHRGTLLRTEPGNATRFRCPFHGFTWDLQGRLVAVPAEWDFPHVRPEEFCLPQAHVAFWGGFVFVNLADDPEPFEDYVEILPEHFAAFPLEDRYLAAHVAKVMPCNWKLAQEAFIESYHIPVAHAQTAAYVGDLNTQYDVYPGVRHVNRMITCEGVPSPSLRDVPPQATVRRMQRDLPFHSGNPIDVGPGDKVRALLAERARRKIGAAAGRDLSGASDAEVLDAIEYFLFPNLVPWAGHGVPIAYRFRPNGDDPETSIMELMLLFAKAEDGSHPPAASCTQLTVEQSWQEAPELGGAGFIVDQDTDNLRRIQRGLRASRKGAVTLARYQESRIRHFHETLDHYVGLAD